jgi:hypothetical protein
MSQQQGSNSRLLYQTEVTYKQVPSNQDAMVLPFVSESLRSSRNLISSNTIRSSRNPVAPVRGNVDVSGDISFELAPQYGKILHHAFGTYTAVSGESVGMVAGTYKHTFKVGVLPVGLIIEKQFTDIDTAKYFQYSGCKINSLKVSVKPEGMIECSVAIIGAKETEAASSFDSSPVDLGHDPFDGFEAVITEGGASLGIATEIDFTLENNLDGNSYVIDGTGTRHSLPAGTAKVTGTVKVLFENTTLYDKAVASTESSLVIALTHGTGDGTSGNEKLTFTIPELKFTPNAPVISGPSGVLVELPFEAYYDDSSEATAIQADLLSTTAYYG